MRKFILAAAVLFTLALTGCAAVEPDSYSEQGQTTKEAAPDSTSKTAETPQWVGHMNEVHIGMSQSEVKSILGKPNDTDSTEMEGFDGSGTTVMDSWTYGDVFSEADGDDVWMLSFTDGKLDSKTRI